MAEVPSILRLPLELRQHIYSYLMPEQIIPKPIPGVGLTSVTHRPPPPDLLLINSQITEDLMNYYFTISTWKIILSHEFNYFRNDPTLSNLAKWPHLHRIQKVHIMFFCNIFLLREYPSFGLDQFCSEIRRRSARATDIMLTIPGLRLVTVSWQDNTKTGDVEQKASLSDPLLKLKELSQVEFLLGDIVGPDQAEMPLFLNRVKALLPVDARLESFDYTSVAPVLEKRKDSVMSGWFMAEPVQV